MRGTPRRFHNETCRVRKMILRRHLMFWEVMSTSRWKRGIIALEQIRF